MIVCDAGGSTADIGVYEITRLNAEQLTLKELNLPKCNVKSTLFTFIAHFTLGLAAGGGRVNDAFSVLLDEKLSQAVDRDRGGVMFSLLLADGVRDFEEGTKRAFLSPSDSYDVELHSRTLTHDGAAIRDGTLTVEG